MQVGGRGKKTNRNIAWVIMYYMMAITIWPIPPPPPKYFYVFTSYCIGTCVYMISIPLVVMDTLLSLECIDNAMNRDTGNMIFLRICKSFGPALTSGNMRYLKKCISYFSWTAVICRGNSAILHRVIILFRYTCMLNECIQAMGLLSYGSLYSS